MLYLAASPLGLQVGAAPARSSRARGVSMAEAYRIAPSILSADFARLGQEVEDVLAAGADTVHFDVMDNHYVPNLTIGPMVCKALKDYGIKAPIDVHLMVSPVDKIIGEFADAGADFITFHPEATGHIDRSLSLVRAAGCKSGLVFNPSTSLDCLKYVMDKVDIILLMSVNPGFGGQAFIPGTLDKAREARKMIDESGYDIRLEIDGGVRSRRPAVLCAFTPSTRLVSIRRGREWFLLRFRGRSDRVERPRCSAQVSGANIKEVAEAGVDMFVAGSAIFRDPRTEEAYKKTIDAMRDELAAAKVPANKVAA